MQAHTAGKAKGRYICPIARCIVTLGLTGVQLDEPMRVVIESYSPEDRQGLGADRELGPWERDYLANAGDRVFGPGCVVVGDLVRDNPRKWTCVRLASAPDADPATWVVNERLSYRQCAACSSRVASTERTVMPEPWSPRRPYVWRRGGRTVDTKPGPHPAGTVACRDCDPRGDFAAAELPSRDARGMEAQTGLPEEAWTPPARKEDHS
jgi:hypothetical protein